jgi:7-cyano-7-deazaguanine synthase in queuosine biosynthesis
VQCEGASIPKDWATEYAENQPLQVNRFGPSAQVSLRLQELSDPLAGTLEGNALDLVRIAAYVYVADQLVSRGGPADIYGDSWRREMAVCLPVSEPDLWNSPQVRTLLEHVLSFVSGEVWRFAFSVSQSPEQFSLNIDQREVRYNPDSVVLFSGGVDSLCATIEAVLEQRLKPALVSHRSVPFMDNGQQALVKQLRQKISGWQFPHSRFVVNKVKTREHDTTQRTRSFLFAALGTAVASSMGIKTVILADNGLVSLNLPINDQLLGSLASRSTHPKFLASFNALAKEVLQYEPQLSNPLWARTKAECLAVLQRHQVPELLQATNSCSHRRGLSNDRPHCGVCSQCVDRRFASLAAGMDAFDSPDRYKKDIFRDALDGKALTMAESYLRFFKKAQFLSPEALYLEYPQLGEAILPDDPSPDTTASKFALLIQRHSRSVVDVVDAQVKAASRDLVLGLLPATCLTSLAIQVPAAATGTPQQLPLVTLSEQEEQEFERHRFKCRLPVRVTGQTEGRKSNVVTIGGREVILPDAQFKLFLRLVVALYETKDGFVDRGQMKQGGGLAEEEIYFPEELDQAVGRLRWRLGPALVDLKPTKYIEVQRKKIRLSTHSACVSVDREALLKHPADQIRSLAARLPLINALWVAPSSRLDSP